MKRVIVALIIFIILMVGAIITLDFKPVASTPKAIPACFPTPVPAGYLLQCRIK